MLAQTGKGKWLTMNLENELKELENVQISNKDATNILTSLIIKGIEGIAVLDVLSNFIKKYPKEGDSSLNENDISDLNDILTAITAAKKIAQEFVDG